MKQERFSKFIAPASSVKPSAAFIPLRKHDAMAEGWILKKAKEIGAETLKAEREAAHRVDWPKVKRSLSFGFYKAAEPKPEPEKTPMQILDRNTWRAIYAYCQDQKKEGKPVKLRPNVWEKIYQVEMAERARLDTIRPSSLDRAILKACPGFAKGL